jgi:very-short-patch-repair endonuclease
MRKRVKIQLAREFRKNPTKSEKIMWGVLRNRQFSNFKFRRQCLIEGYLVDFFCHELGLAIEIDGEIHLQQLDADKERQRIIENNQIRFLRIKSADVENNLNIVTEKIKLFIDNINLLPSPTKNEREKGWG